MEHQSQKLCLYHLVKLLYKYTTMRTIYLISVMNSTCIQYEGSRAQYIHVQILGNMHKTPYTAEKLQKIHIHLTTTTTSST